MHCDPDQSDAHAERLFACLFVLGTQRADRDRLLEGLELGLRLRDGAEGETRLIIQRETAVIASARARLTDDPADWQLAETLFDDSDEPLITREQFFFYFYRGLVKRALASSDPTRPRLFEAVASFAPPVRWRGSLTGRFPPRRLPVAKRFAQRFRARRPRPSCCGLDAGHPRLARCCCS